MVQIKIIFLLLAAGFFTNTAFAQDLSRAERKAISEQAIKDLKGGILIVRLKSKQNKISAIEKLLYKSDVKQSDKIQLQKELEKTIDERNRFNLSLTQAFEKYYSFSDVYYMYDTASVSLKAGTKSGIFLTENLELDPSIKIPEGRFFVIRNGTTDASTTTGLEAMVVMDDQLRDLTRPFPYYVAVNRLGRVFIRIFSPKTLTRKDTKLIVQTLEKRFNRYLDYLEERN